MFIIVVYYEAQLIKITFHVEANEAAVSRRRS